MILYAELPRTMRCRAFVLYAFAKIKDNMLRDNYFFDCLWCMATDMRFMKDKEATLPRWSEIAGDKHVEKKPLLTKEMVKNSFLRLVE